jgi:uncharacterized protein (TIGR03083 family)
MSDSHRVASLASQASEVAQGLADYLGRLPSTEWPKPSDCEGWPIAAVVGHLVLVEALIGSSISRGLQGDSGPPPEGVSGPEAWREHRAREIARLSALTPPELLAQFQSGLDTIQEPLAKLASGEGHDALGWHPNGIQRLPWFAGQWLVEVSLHDWDIRVSRDPTARVNPVAWPGLGPEMRARMPRCFKPKPSLDQNGIVRVDLSGRPRVAWLARIGDGQLELLTDGAAEPDTTIQTDAGSYALVQTARRPAWVFEQTGQWRVDGDVELAERLAASFVGY